MSTTTAQILKTVTVCKCDFCAYYREQGFEPMTQCAIKSCRKDLCFGEGCLTQYGCSGSEDYTLCPDCSKLYYAHSDMNGAGIYNRSTRRLIPTRLYN